MSLWTMTDEAAGKPKYLSDELRNDQTVSDKDATLGISTTEAVDADSAAKGLRTPGWVTYTTYTDANGNVRHKSEVLVAAGSMGADTNNATLDDDLGAGGATYTSGVDGTFGGDLVSSGSFGVSDPSPALYAEFNANALAGKSVTFTTASGDFTATITSSGSMGAGFVFCSFNGAGGPAAAATSITIA